MKRVAQAPKKKIRIAANAALFDLRDQPSFLTDAVLKILKLAKAVAVSDDTAFLTDVPKSQRIGFAAAGLDRVLIDQDEVFTQLKFKSAGQISDRPIPQILVTREVMASLSKPSDEFCDVQTRASRSTFFNHHFIQS